MRQNFNLRFQSLKDEKGEPSSWIQVFKLGHFSHPRGDFTVDDQFLEDILANFDELKARNPQTDEFIPIDYNHASLADGVQAKAAGWVTDLQIREDGLWAKVKWTAEAAAMIKANEFKFISPTFSVDDTDEFGEKIDGPCLHAAALTNMPFLRGMAPVSLNKGKETGMIEKLRKLFNLKAEATEDQVIEAITRDSSTIKKLKEAFDLGDKDPVEFFRTLKAEHGEATGRIESLEKSVSSLELKDKTRTAEGLVEGGMKAGKIVPAQKEWAVAYALKDAEGFKKFLEGQPKVVQFGSIGSGGSGTEGEGGEDPITEFQSAIYAKAKELKPADPDSAYSKAYDLVRSEKPELARAYTVAHRKRQQAAN